MRKETQGIAASGGNNSLLTLKQVYYNLFKKGTKMEMLVILRMLALGLLILAIITQLIIPLMQGKPPFPFFHKSEKQIDDALLQTRQEISEKEKQKELEKLKKKKDNLEEEIEQLKTNQPK